ncbi:hypothetical protein MSAN_01324900 [Mycena sanguinolenta]|uniref:Uncharacterized protein n=1 Tax=Mycena sanguinolenta TaxID=230812 RepID=A0A8H7D0R8_9AGAR|nr:hypothetical protein MSAN_01324900 [Mycena sanguinolenta]
MQAPHCQALPRMSLALSPLRSVGASRPLYMSASLFSAFGSLFASPRWEAQTRVKYSGYTSGFNFEEAWTDLALGCEEGTGHHRIVKYDLNGLEMVVRFEVDACIPPSAAKASAMRKVQSIDDLANDPAPVSSHGLTVINGGAVVPHSSILELTTRTQRRAAKFDWNDAYPQLFLQTPHHFLAVHDRGRFP